MKALKLKGQDISETFFKRVRRKGNSFDCNIHVFLFFFLALLVRCDYFSKARLLSSTLSYHTKTPKTYLCSPFAKPFVVSCVDQTAVSYSQMNLVNPAMHLVFIWFSVNFAQHIANLK